MSNAGMAPDHFWREFKTDIAGTLSDAQRGEIERVLGLTPSSGDSALSDLRLSFKWFFVRLVWGPEKRTTERIKQEQEAHPPLATRNLPALLALIAGYIVALLAVLSLGAWLFAYFVF